MPSHWRNLPTDEDFAEAKRVLATGDREQIEAFMGRNRDDRARAAAEAARAEPVRWMGFEDAER